MRALIPRTLVLHLSPNSPLRASLLFFHSATGDEPHRRRTEPHNPAASHSYTSSSSHRRNYDEENRSVKVTVWWDFENCQVPVGVRVDRVANRIMTALRSTGIKGPVTITAFGDVAQMSRATQEALTSTGVCLNHVPHRGKNSSDRSFMADLVYWVTQNPPPAHFFLISSDKDFANILHRLRMSNYNILLASNDIASCVLCSAATIMWPWTELVKGENITAKHFNHPPDGLYGSWYGHFKGVLDDPFLSSEQCAISEPEESMESISETKFRPIPRVVVNGIRNVLHSYPEGMYISELRGELRRKNIALDKDLYGHKKFSNLLASMPSIVKFIPNPSGEGQPLVSDKRFVDSVEISSKPSNDSVEFRSKPAKEAQSSKVEKKYALPQDEKPLPVAPPDTADATAGVPAPIPVDVSASVPTPIPVDMNAAVPTPLPTHDAVAKRVAKAESTTPEQGSDVEVKEGLFRRIWTRLTGRSSGRPAPSNKNDITSEMDSTSTEETIKGKDPPKLASNEKSALLKNSSSYAPNSSNAIGTKKYVPDEESMTQSEKQNGTPNPRMGFFSQLANWWQPQKPDAKDQVDSFESVKKHVESDGSGEHSIEMNPVSWHPEAHALFSRSDFWDALECFLRTSNGADLISKSSSRKQLVHKLQKEGPPNLKYLKESHILKLVELLISDKKWVEESTSPTFPFKLMVPGKRRYMPSNGHGSNGLSSLFSSRKPQPNAPVLSEQEKQVNYSHNGSEEDTPPKSLAELKAWFQRTCNGTEDIKLEEFQKLFESKFNKKLVCSSYGHPTIQSLHFACSADNFSQGRKKKPPTKEEILSDCHKLLMELLRENPEGFNMSNFRPAFFQKYGYILDCQILGHPKLVSLLQIMPGVKIESSYVLPASMLTSDSNQVTSNLHADGLDSEGSSNGEDWEELGPVSVAKRHPVGKEMSYSKVSLSDEEFTDSDDEIPSQLDEPTKQPKREEEDSSLMQILDSWYSNKEGGGGGKDQDHTADGLVDCSRSNPQNTSDLTLADNPNMRVRHPKRYSFVADSGDDEKDKLVDNILGSLKKAGDSRLQS